MTIWAIADLHLSFGVPNKKMDRFGAQWVDHAETIRAHWRRLISPEDLVLIAGDLSWAMRLEEAAIDLNWLGELPGTKVLIRGNHDYWWDSPSKIKKILPSSVHLIQNDAFKWKDVSIGGARLWDSAEYSFHEWIEFQGTPPELAEKKEDEKIFLRELGRSELSLKALDQKAHKRIVMTHYPPIGADLKPSRVSALLEKYRVDCCVFGHLHSLKKGISLFGEARAVKYILTSCDYLNFYPIIIF